jgi:CubicO group peptidase (beta-lactamase class C family)
VNLAGLAFALVGIGPAADTPRAVATAAVFEGLVRGDEPGLAVLVRQDGKTVFERGYGVRDLRSRERIDPDTAFRLASVTKQLTATAVMLLVRDGKLRYDDALADLVPFPAYGQGITIRHLLTHTSGLPDYEDLMAAAEQGRSPIWTAVRQIHDDEVLALLRGAQQGRFPPGTRCAYSNSGYVVLGLIVARVSGKPFGEFLHQHVFAPLRVQRTLAYERGRNEVAGRAFGHTREGDGFRQGTLVSPAAMKARSPADVTPRRDDRVPHGDRALPGQPAHGRDPRQPQRPRPGRAPLRAAEPWLTASASR